MSLFYTCPICESSSDKKPSNKDGENVVCPRCGRYFISRSALLTLKKTRPNPRQIANLSGWLRENPEVAISSDNLDTLLTIRTPSVSERAEKIMAAIERKSMFIGDIVGITYDDNEDGWLSTSWSVKKAELVYLVEKYLIQEQGWIVDAKAMAFADITVQLTPTGYAYLDQLKQGQGTGVQGFCAMWFNEKVTPIWTEAISPAISGAGYRPIRIDEVNHNNRIDDEILAQIRRSRFVVADFTGDRGGVYFEAGFALGLGIQVIWTVQAEELSKVHFDNRQYNFLQWRMDDLPAFKKALQSRIEATLGFGPLVV
jgi:hypothetical protein